jgi:hypothetical protein
LSRSFFTIVASLLFPLVHGWINGHFHDPRYSGHFADVYDFVTYFKRKDGPTSKTLFFDTGDFTDVSFLLVRFSHVVVALPLFSRAQG